MRGERVHARFRVVWLAAMALSCAAAGSKREASVARGLDVACDAGLYTIDGACLGPREIRAYCGSNAVGATCVLRTCAPHEALDARAASCLSERDMRDLVAASRPAATRETETSAPDPSLRASCHDDRILLAHDDHAACVVRSDVCPRGVRLQPANGCPAVLPCPRGEVRDHALCVPVVAHGILDVGAWARAILGPDGGVGDDRLCAPLAAAPWDFDVGPGGSLLLALNIDLVFPDNDPTAVTASVTSNPSVPLSSEGAHAVQAAVESLLIPLRALGGTADAASVSLHLTCPIRGGSSPRLEPRLPADVPVAPFAPPPQSPSGDD